MPRQMLPLSHSMVAVARLSIFVVTLPSTLDAASGCFNLRAPRRASLAYPMLRFRLRSPLSEIIFWYFCGGVWLSTLSLFYLVGTQMSNCC